MVDLRWDGDDFRNEQDSSGSTADFVSHSGKLQQGYQHGSLTEGLVAYYPMEKGEGEVLHDGALNNLGQIKGASWVNGNIGSNSLSFNGSSDYVAASIPSGIGEFTASAWVSSNNWDQSGFEFAIGFAAGGGDSGLGIHNGNVRYSGGGNETGLDKGDVSSFTDGEFHHIAIVHSNERGTRTLYLDGQDIGGDTDTGDTTDGTIRIGSAIGGSAWWNGNLEEIRIYDRALSQPEIEALYNLTKPSGTQVTEKQVPGKDQGGISRYKLNGDVSDSWGSNNATDNTTVSPSYVTGVYGQAKNFDGSDDYISIGNPSSLDFSASDSFTIAHWINIQDLSSDRHHIISTRSGDNNWIWTGTYTDGNLEFRCKGDSNSNFVRYGVKTGSWFHVVGTYDGNDTVSLFINGNLKGRDSSNSLTGSFTGNDEWEIGRRQSPSYRRWYNGLIDDIRIYNTALVPQQVEKLYQKGAYRIPRESTLQ